MSEVLPFIILGLGTGAVYALAGVGLTLTFKTSGVFNFGHGALATVAAYVLYSLMVTQGLAQPLAVLICVFLIGPIMGIGLSAVSGRVRDRGFIVNVGSTIGILLLVQAIIELIYPTQDQRVVPSFLGTGTAKIGGTTVQWADIYTLAIGIVATAMLSGYLRMSRAGMAMRAVVDDQNLLDTSGISPNRVRVLAWVIGCTFAAASGVLFAPLLPLNPSQLTMLVVAAYGAAAIGAFRSLAGTFVGGLIIGVLASLATYKYTSGLGAGLAPSLPFLVLVALLVVYPNRRRPLPYVSERSVPRPQWRAPNSLNLAFGCAALVVLGFGPELAGFNLTAWTVALATSIVFLSLSLLVRTSGQVGLCQVSFMAIGAAAFSHLAVGAGVPWLIALLLAGGVAIPVGALLAIPSIRLPRLYLTLATFGFGIVLQHMFYDQSYMFGYSSILEVPRPHVSFLTLDSDTGYYYVVLIFLVLTVLLLVGLDRTRLGRLLRGVADGPIALQSSGASVNITRLLVFCASAFIAAVGGALAAAAQSPVSGLGYDPNVSVTYFAIIAIVSLSAPWNSVLAGFLVILLPVYLQGQTITEVMQAVFGASLLLMALQPESVGHLPPSVTAYVDRLFRRGRFVADRRSAPPQAIEKQTLPRFEEGKLEVTNVHVRFGGLVAVNDLSLTAKTGEITGLIGPNGAGKTTTFNVCSGHLRPNEGRITLDGRNIARLSPPARARLGIGRTFQRLELFDSLTVRENVVLGAEARFANANPIRHLLSSRFQRREVDAEVANAIAQCELTDIADSPVANLSTGQRRMVDFARCLAGGPRIVLLDEPTSGLSTYEKAQLVSVLRTVVDERGVGVLLVEHDLTLVLDVCESIYVLDFGQVLFHGSPSEIVQSPEVRAAYLGEPTAEMNEDAGNSGFDTKTMPAMNVVTEVRP